MIYQKNKPPNITKPANPPTIPPPIALSRFKVSGDMLSDDGEVLVGDGVGLVDTTRPLEVFVWVDDVLKGDVVVRRMVDVGDGIAVDSVRLVLSIALDWSKLSFPFTSR